MATSDLQGASRLRSRMNVGTPNVPAIEEQQETEQISPRERFNRLITGRTAEPFAESDTKIYPLYSKSRSAANSEYRSAPSAKALSSSLTPLEASSAALFKTQQTKGSPLLFQRIQSIPAWQLDVDANGSP